VFFRPSVVFAKDRSSRFFFLHARHALTVLSVLLLSKISGAPLLRWIVATRCYRTRPICSQSLNGKTVEVLVNPRGLSVDVLNDDTGGLLSSRARGHTYSVRLTHEAETNNNPGTEAHTGNFFFGLSNVGKSY
jgi:hypothetical protein